MRAEASSLMLLDHASNELYFQEVRGGEQDVKEIRGLHNFMYHLKTISCVYSGRRE